MNLQVLDEEAVGVKFGGRGSMDGKPVFALRCQTASESGFLYQLEQSAPFYVERVDSHTVRFVSQDRRPKPDTDPDPVEDPNPDIPATDKLPSFERKVKASKKKAKKRTK